MIKVNHKTTIKEKRKIRVRKKLFGTIERPRLNVLRSNKHIHLQVIDDTKGVVLASVTDYSKKDKMQGTKTEKSTKVAQVLAEKLKEKKIEALVFDRGYYKFHGRIKAVAEALKKGGIKV